MSPRLTILCVLLALIASEGCEKQAAPNGKPPAATSQAQVSDGQTKELTNEVFLIWLDLVTVWHQERIPDRLERVAKARGWKELTPDQLEVIGAKRGYAFRVNETAVLVGGDDEGGNYSVVVNTPLDSEAIIRQFGQAFDIHQFGDLSEAGLNTRMYSLITGGAPVGIATVDTSVVESSNVTRIGFIAVDRAKLAGFKLPPNLSRLSELIDKAKAGDATSQVKLGDAYFTGTFGKPDPALAVDYWRMAAKQQDPAGSHRLAVAYYAGIGVEKSLEIASDLFEQAATAGDAEGQAMTGWMYATGDGKRRDPAKAAEWLKRAVSQGHAGAANSLAGLYEKGQGVERDQSRALALYRDSAAKGYGLAHFNLGRAYAFGYGVPMDKTRAAQCFQSAADMGIAEGEYSLAVLYIEGNGIPRDFAKAADLFEKAANKGHAGAQNNLGLFLARGTGRSRDLIEGAKWWIIASASGSADATANLPEMKNLLSRADLQEAERRAAAFKPNRASEKLLPF
jgi:TPR repeat protein